MCAMVSTQKLDNLYLHPVNAGRMPLVIKMQWLKKKLPWQLLLVRLARAQDIYLRLYFCLHICAASHIMVFKIAEPSHRLVQTIFKVQPASTESLYKTHFSRVSIGNPIDTIANTVTYLGQKLQRIVPHHWLGFRFCSALTTMASFRSVVWPGRHVPCRLISRFFSKGVMKQGLIASSGSVCVTTQQRIAPFHTLTLVKRYVSMQAAYQWRFFLTFSRLGLLGV